MAVRSRSFCTIAAPDNRLLARWQAQSSNGDLARIEAEGTFDKAELARATGHDEPLITDAQVEKELEAVDVPRRRWSALFAVATRSRFSPSSC